MHPTYIAHHPPSPTETCGLIAFPAVLFADWGKTLQHTTGGALVISFPVFLTMCPSYARPPPISRAPLSLSLSPSASACPYLPCPTSLLSKKKHYITPQDNHHTYFALLSLYVYTANLWLRIFLSPMPCPNRPPCPADEAATDARQPLLHLSVLLRIPTPSVYNTPHPLQKKNSLSALRNACKHEARTSCLDCKMLVTCKINIREKNPLSQIVNNKRPNGINSAASSNPLRAHKQVEVKNATNNKKKQGRNGGGMPK